MDEPAPEQRACQHEHLKVTFDLRAGSIQVSCSTCYGTWPEPDTPPGLMDTALIGAKELIRRKVISDYKEGLP